MPSVPDPAVEVRGLTIRYQGRGPGAEPVTAVDGLDLDARAGQVTVMLGPNGAGKTSTVEALEGYRRPAGGTVRVLGLDPGRDHTALTARMGVMLQRGGVYPMLGPRRVLDLFARYYDDPLRTEDLLDLVRLRPVATTPWRHLSGGEQQRLSLALALVGRPEVAFLDEPTAGVDPEGRQAVRAVVDDLRSTGVCVLLTTHELGEAELMADRIVIMSAGHVVRAGAPGELTAGTVESMRFGAPRGLDTGALAGALGPGCTVSEVSPGRYRVEGASGPGATATLATWLAERQLTLSDLATGRTLEDVYFEAVGAAGSEPEGGVEGPGTRRRARRAAGGRRPGART